MSGGQQFGYAILGGVERASLWSSSAVSRVDLHPAGSTRSKLLAAYGGQQAGFATIGGVGRASLWSGTPASRVDLHAFVPAAFTSSTAMGLTSDGTYLYACGSGSNSVTGRTEALLWKRSLCTAAPSIENHPHAAASCPGGTASFSVGASSVGTCTYQWRKAAVAINPSDNPSAATMTLVLTNVVLADVAGYDCIVTNPCGSVTSRAATLAVCASDFNCDGAVSFFDYEAFVICFEGSSCPPGRTADFDGDGSVDFFDYDDFALSFEAGC